MRKSTFEKYIAGKRNIMITGALAVCAALGWWGAIYPQFTLLDSTYDIVYEEEPAQTEEGMAGAVPDSGELYWEILDADCSRIRFKSRLLTEWNALLELRRGVHESGGQQ